MVGSSRLEGPIGQHRPLEAAGSSMSAEGVGTPPLEAGVGSILRGAVVWRMQLGRSMSPLTEVLGRLYTT